MIEAIMYFGIGFLLATLVAVALIPFVHSRAVRLTTRRLEDSIPQSMAEIQAGKDALRAEFAMSTRRLEITIDGLKNRETNQLAELGKNRDADNRLKIEREAQKVEVAALKADGIQALAGNAADPALIPAANLGEARCLLVAIPDAFEGGQVVQQAHAINPKLPIIARAHSEEEIGHLKRHGASLVVMGEHEIAKAMLDNVVELATLVRQGTSEAASPSAVAEKPAATT